jgi:hypothetical protein
MAKAIMTCTACNCNAPAKIKGLCGKHYQRNRKHGDKEYVSRATRGAASEWIAAHIDFAGDDCLIWPFGVGSNGRPAARLNGRLTSGPRVMCILAHGEPPKSSMHASHSCGGGHLGCMNPKHLRWATPSENEADKIAHGTLRKGRAINTNVLSESAVREIRASVNEKGTDLAARFGVSTSLVSSIRNKRCWAWLPDL